MVSNAVFLCRVDPWECYQDTWQTTCSVLEHHRDLMKVCVTNMQHSPIYWKNKIVRLALNCHFPLKPWSIYAISMQRVTGCILSNVNTPSTTPVIGQPQNTTSPIYQNRNTPNKPTAGKCVCKFAQSLYTTWWKVYGSMYKYCIHSIGRIALSREGWYK